MAKDDIIAARLDLIAAKAKILSEQYKNNQMWDGELESSLNTIEGEIAAIRRESGSSQGWASSNR